jgi:hypothetical protein
VGNGLSVNELRIDNAAPITAVVEVIH